jgi:hypothetical protein
LTTLISNLNKKEVNEKKFLEFLLAIDNFSSKTRNILLPTQFFINKILNKNTCFLINLNRDCFSQLNFRTENLDQINFAEDLKYLQSRLQELRNEKNQLEKLQYSDSYISHLLSELTRDYEKLRIEKCRDFKHEISQLEMLLATNKLELKKITEIVEVNEKELLTSIDQVEVELKFNQKKLFYLQDDLIFLQQLEKQIDSLEINKTFLKLFNLEYTRVRLISEWEEFDPITILIKEIKEPNTDLKQLRTEKKITTDLSENIKNITIIIENLKDILQFFSIHSKNTNKIFLKKVKLILDIISDKRKLEIKTIKIAKLLKNSEPNDTIQALLAQFKMNKDLYNDIHANYSYNQKILIEFLQKNNSELKDNIKELIHVKQIEISTLLNMQSILELMTKKTSLINQINELEEKIHVTKNEQHTLKLLEDHKLLEELVYLERLQKKTESTIQKIDDLHKEITENDNILKSLKKDDSDPPNFQLNKEKIRRLENKKSLFYSDLYKLEENHKAEIELEKKLKDPIERTINNIKNTQISNFSNKLTQNERSLRFNLRETRQLTQKIEKLSLLARQSQFKNQLLQEVIQKSSQNRLTSQDNTFLDELKTQLSSIKVLIENQVWNKSGWSFFYKKVPDGIQKLREIFNKKNFNRLSPEPDDDENQVILIWLSLFSEIKLLVDKKNLTNNFFRCQAVNDLYQSLQISLNAINAKFFTLQNSTTKIKDNMQLPCFSFLHQ